MASVKQVSFAGGELSPLLWGRSDLPVFGKGVRRMRNFFPTTHGAAMSRPGTTFCGYAKANSLVRLVPFVYADGQSFVLEFGGQYIRFWSQGGLVQSGGGPLEVATPFLSTDNLRFVQSGDVLTILNGKHGLGPYELKRISNTNWTLAPITFANVFTWFTIPPVLAFIGAPPSTVPATPPAILTTDGGTSFGGYSAGTIAGTYPTDATHPAREWQWCVTAIGKDNATGATFETLPVLVTTKVNANGSDSSYVYALETNMFPLAVDRAVTLRRLPLQSGINWQTPVGVGTWTALGYIYYRGRGAQPTAIPASGAGIYPAPGYFTPGGGLFGFVGQSLAGDFVDTGDAPDYSRQPPQGTAPFIAGEFPYAATFFQERLIYGGSSQRPSRLAASATEDFKNFDVHTLPIAGEALDLTLTSRKREEVRFLVPHTKLVVLTDSSVRSLSGQQGPLDFDNINAQLEEEIGCAELAGPVVVDGAVLFPRTKGFGVRALAFNWNRQGYVGSDISLVSQHLFQGQAVLNAAGLPYPSATPLGTAGGLTPNWRTIYSWTYAEDPWGLVWAVTSDGSLLSLTFSQEQQVAGWARHDTDGWFTNVAAIPELGPSGELEDYVYAAVLRQSAAGYNIYIERFTSRAFYGTPFDGICLDSALKYSGAPTQTLTGLNHLVGKQIYVTGVGNPVYGPFTVDAAGAVTLDDMPVANSGTDVVLYAGLLFTPELELLDLAQGEVRSKEKTVSSVLLEVDNAKGLFAGQSFNDLVEWRQREVSDSYLAPGLATIAVKIRTKGRYDLAGRAALRQTLPLPVTVLGVTREVDVGGS